MRLWQRLFLACAGVSGVALFGFAAWQQRNFSSGFLAYLDAVATQRAELAAERLAAAWEKNGRDWLFLRGDIGKFGEIVDADRRPEPPGPPPDMPNRGPADTAVAPSPPRPGSGPPGPPPGMASRGSGRMPGGAPPEWWTRLLLLDGRGQRVAGDPGAELDDSRMRALPIRAGGTQVGTLYVSALVRPRGGPETTFVEDQWRAALIAGLATLGAALLVAFALSRWLLQPVRALARGTRRLAAGDYSHQLDLGRAGKDELRALGHDFNALARALESHRQARQRWGADIAHELRTPVTILRAELQALLDGIRQPDRPALESLQGECARLGALIDDLYQLALADAGALEYRFQPLDLVELVLDSIEAHRGALARAGLRLEVVLPETANVRGDFRRLGQLLDNLLVNARRYTDGPGTVRVRVTPANMENEVRMDVEDSPPGVAAADQARLFDRLFRVDASRNRAAGGAGLGLSICQAIVTAHQGRIEASDSPLGGLRLSVYLPVAEAGAPE